jgi:hypothetical protein
MSLDNRGELEIKVTHTVQLVGQFLRLGFLCHFMRVALIYARAQLRQRKAASIKISSHVSILEENKEHS